MCEPVRRVKMKMVALTGEQITTAFNGAGADLKFLMDKEGVDREVQARLYLAGVDSVKQLAVVFKDADDLRKLAKDSLDVDPEGSLPERAKLAKLVVAMERAKLRSFKEAEYDSIAHAKGTPKPLSVTDHQGMKDSFEAKLWELAEDDDVPSRGYIERKLDEIEKKRLEGGEGHHGDEHQGGCHGGDLPDGLGPGG